MIKCDKGFYREKEIKEKKELIKQSIIVGSVIFSMIIGCIFDKLRKEAIIGAVRYTVFENIETFFGMIFIISFAIMILNMFFDIYIKIYRRGINNEEVYILSR